MRVVLDTNVIIAAFAARGLCEAVFELCLKECEIIASEAILKEVRDNLRKKIKLPAGHIEDIESFLREYSIVIKPPKLAEPVCRDSDDDLILAAAEAAEADILVTGDRDLLSLKKFKDTIIVTPREFWKILESKRNQ